MMSGSGGVDEIAAQPPKARQCAIFIRPREPAVADNIHYQNRRDFTLSPMALPLGVTQN